MTIGPRHICRICGNEWRHHERRCRHAVFEVGRVRRCIKDAADGSYCEKHKRH